MVKTYQKNDLKNSWRKWFKWVIDELVNDNDFEKSEKRRETSESKEEIKDPQKYEDGNLIIPDDLIEKGMKDPGVKSLFKKIVA